MRSVFSGVVQLQVSSGHWTGTGGLQLLLPFLSSGIHEIHSCAARRYIDGD
jgi:hypothetical protein